MRNTAESTVTDVLTGPEGFRPDQNYIGAGRTATVLFHLLLGGLAVVLFAGLANLLRSQQEDTLSQTMITSHLDEKGQLRPLAEVIEITRSLKLITVVVDSTVQAKTSVDTWRGDVSAVVEAPVRYVYGVDLSRLEPDAFRAGKILGGYDIVVPQPERVAVEVDGSNPTKEEVNVTGTRFRTRAGEYYLGLSRKKLYEQAKENALSEKEMQKVHKITKEQIEELVRRFVGQHTYVKVRYENE